MPALRTVAGMTLLSRIAGLARDAACSRVFGAGPVWSSFALAFMLVRWWKMTEPTRPRRIALFPVLAVAFWALVLVFLWPAWPEQPAGPLALITSSIIVQCVSPWEPPPPPLPRRVRLRHVG